MGQKIRPNLLRLGIIGNWKSRWWPKKHYSTQLEEDVLIREVINKKVVQAGIISIEIERGADGVYKVFIKVARPGLVIGRGGKGIEELSKEIEGKLRSLLKKRGEENTKISISLNVEELKRSEISAQYMSQSIAWDLERRIRARRTMKKYLDLIMQNREVQGAKLKLSGRIDGREIARDETLIKGKLPLQTLRANIDYGQITARTTYGTIGIKVWIYKGEVFAGEENKKKQ